jgi:hypothetical protein
LVVSVTVSDIVTKKVKNEPTVGNPSAKITPTGSATSMADMEFPAAWFKQEKWRRNVVPTLCLWAGAQTDVWGIMKEKIACVLKLILPVAFLQLVELPNQLTPQHKIVAVVFFFLEGFIRHY